jgi:hypothetical protein
MRCFYHNVLDFSGEEFKLESNRLDPVRFRVAISAADPPNNPPHASLFAEPATMNQ